MNEKEKETINGRKKETLIKASEEKKEKNEGKKSEISKEHRKGIRKTR